MKLRLFLLFFLGIIQPAIQAGQAMSLYKKTEPVLKEPDRQAKASWGAILKDAGQLWLCDMAILGHGLAFMNKYGHSFEFEDSPRELSWRKGAAMFFAPVIIELGREISEHIFDRAISLLSPFHSSHINPKRSCLASALIPAMIAEAADEGGVAMGIAIGLIFFQHSRASANAESIAVPILADYLLVGFHLWAQSKAKNLSV